LGLGRHLVRELGFHDGTDTLGRWMAHHVAELIQKSKNGSTAAERSKARNTATETILKIWQHRTSLPGDAYPLTSYKGISKVLDLLRPDDNPFKHFGHHPNAKREELAGILFDRLSRLIIALLLMSYPLDRSSKKVNAAAFKALSRKEQHVLKALQQWGELFASTSEGSQDARKGKKGGGAKVTLDETAVQLIDSISNTLIGLREEIQKASEAVRS